MKNIIQILLFLVVLYYGSMWAGRLIEMSSQIVNRDESVSVTGDSPSLMDQFFSRERSGNITIHRDPLIDQLLKGHQLPQPSFPLYNPGLSSVLDYTQYGEFRNRRTKNFRYTTKKRGLLRMDIGAGIMPNVEGIKLDLEFQRLKSEGLLAMSPWKALKLDDDQRAFYIWTQARVGGGARAYFTAVALERAGHILQAIKAYYAVVVHYPKSYVWGEDRSFVWYCAQAAMDNIHRLTRDYAALNLLYVDNFFSVENGYDKNVRDDVVVVDPGEIIAKSLEDKIAGLPDLKTLERIQTRGTGKVQLHQFENLHWLMTVDGRPFYLRGMTYNPTAIGLGPKSDANFLSRWMFSDINGNGLIDAPYDAWVDRNQNNRQDTNEPAVGDFALLKKMGVNAIRVFVENNPKMTYDPSLFNKELLRDMYQRFGISVIVGDFLGAYTIGTDATWEQGVDYRDEHQRALMKEAVRQKVLDLKDEDFVLMWLLGNENNMAQDYLGHNATRTNASVYPQAYASLLNEVADMIHEIDPDHPVAVGNIETGLLEVYQQYAASIDILGINSYRGTPGFGGLFSEARLKFDRPIIISEYGCDAYAAKQGEDQGAQKTFIENKFRDIIFNQAGGPGEGNALGGVVFEYLDEWWKDTFDHPEDEQQTESQFSFAFPDGFSHEEWYGVMGQGKGSSSPFLRQSREIYDYFVGLFN